MQPYQHVTFQFTHISFLTFSAEKKLFYPHNGYPSIFYKHFACLPHLLSCHPHTVCFDSTVFLLFWCVFPPTSLWLHLIQFPLIQKVQPLFHPLLFTSRLLSHFWGHNVVHQVKGSDSRVLIFSWYVEVFCSIKAILVSSGTFIQNVVEGWSLLICTFRVWCQRSCSHGGFFQWASPGPDCSSCHQMHPPPSFCVLCCLSPHTSILGSPGSFIPFSPCPSPVHSSPKPCLTFWYPPLSPYCSDSIWTPHTHTLLFLTPSSQCLLFEDMLSLDAERQFL